MDYIVLMKKQENMREEESARKELESRLNELKDEGEITNYHRFITGHFAIRGISEQTANSLRKISGIEAIVEPGKYAANNQEYRI